MTDNNPTDPFSTLDVDINEFKNTASESKEITTHVEIEQPVKKEVIIEATKGTGFKSREAGRSKGKQYVSKSFSLFQEDLDSISYCIDRYKKRSEEHGVISASDVVRAGLVLLENLPENEFLELLKNKKGRGR